MPSIVWSGPHAGTEGVRVVRIERGHVGDDDQEFLDVEVCFLDRMGGHSWRPPANDGVRARILALALMAGAASAGAPLPGPNPPEGCTCGRPGARLDGVHWTLCALWKPTK